MHEVVGDLEGETRGCVVGPQQRLLKQQTTPWTKGTFFPAPDTCLHPYTYVHPYLSAPTYLPVPVYLPVPHAYLSLMSVCTPYMSAPLYLAHRKGLARELNEGDTAARSKLEDQVRPDRLQVRVLQRPRLPGCWHAGCLSSRCLFRGRRSRCRRGWLPQAGGSLWSRPGSCPGDCGVSGPLHTRHGISAP